MDSEDKEIKEKGKAGETAQRTFETVRYGYLKI